MTKAELAAAVADKAQMTKKDADAAVTAVFEVITEALSKGDKVQLMGFGGFDSKQRNARSCINPRTGERVNVPATRVPSFKAGKALKDAVAK